MIMSLPKTMEAVVVHGIEDYRLEEVPVPQVGAGDVLVRVRATGVCASDVKAYYGARVWGSEQIVPCWQCRFCQRGQYWMCQRHDIYGFKYRRDEGSWAEYMKFPAGAINHKVPSEVKGQRGQHRPRLDLTRVRYSTRRFAD
jgi:threonine dehydrogenase-like Zn-dependent dehydrogenase